MTTLEDVNSLDEAAAYLRITPAAVIGLVRRGKLGSLKEGRTRTFPREVLEEYVSRYTVAAAPANPHGLTDRALARTRGGKSA